MKIKNNKENISIVAVCFILAIVVALQFKSTYINSKLDKTTSTRIEVLKDELILTKDLNENLRKRNEEIVKQLSEYENAEGNFNLYEKTLKSELERARMIAGLVDVRGRGIIIKLSNTEYGIVEQDDILKLLNELKACDVQAISVNDERIVATSEVREAGGYIVINGKQILSPFVIKAIAVPEKVENALNMVGGILEQLRELYKLKVETERVDDLVILKVKDDGSANNIDLLKIAE